MKSTSGDDRLGDDNYSLHTEVGSPVGSIMSDGSPSGELQVSDDADVLQRYKQLSIDLYTTPCYATSSAGYLSPDFDRGNFAAAYHSRFREQDPPHDWKPAFSGKKYRYLLTITVWLALAGHYATSKLARTAAGRRVAFGEWAPAALSSVLVAFTVFVVDQEIRRESYQVLAVRSNRRALIRHRRSLRTHRWLITCVLAPLLSVPLRSVRFVSEPTWNAFLRPAAPLVTFASWEDVAQYFSADLPTLDTSVEASLPSLSSSSPSKNHHGAAAAWGNPQVQERISWDAWRLSGNPNSLDEYSSPKSEIKTAKFLHWMERNLDGTSRRASDEWRDVIDGDILVMPVSLQHDFSTATTVDAVVRAPFRLLAPKLLCERHRSANFLPLPVNVPYYQQVKNSYCYANVRMLRHTLGNETRGALARACENEIKRLERALDDVVVVADGKRIPLQKRLEELREEQTVLRGEEEVQMFVPGWFKMDKMPYLPENSGLCENTLFFIGDNRPLRRASEESMLASSISVAECRLFFEYKTHIISMHGRSGWLLGQGLSSSSMDSAAARGLLLMSRGALDFKSGYLQGKGTWSAWIDDLASSEYWRDWRVLEVGEGEHKVEAIALTQGIMDRISTGRLGFTHDGLWPQQLLEYGVYDAMHASDLVSPPDDELTALALASQRLYSWIVEQLSEAADLALAELVAASTISKRKGVRHLKGDLIWTTLRERDFSSFLWVRGTVLVVAIVCSRLVRSAHDNANDEPSGFPWSVETIAAKAALLCRSRLRSTFGSAHHTADEIRAISGLRIGHWVSHSDQGNATRRGWRLDARSNVVLVDNVALKDEPERTPPIWQRHAKTSLPAIARPFFTATQTTILIALLAIVLSSMATVGPDMFTQSNLAAVLTSDTPMEPGFLATAGLMLLPQCLVFYLLACWTDLDGVYSARQPWASLSSPKPARLNVTLNYLDDCRWRVWRALVNRHYLVALLGLGSAVGFGLPVLTAGMVRLEAGREHVGVVRGKRDFAWATFPSSSNSQPGDSAAEVTGGVQAAGGLPINAINAIIRPPPGGAGVDWAVRNHVVLPVDLDFSTTVPPSGTLWRMHAQSLISKLDCHDDTFDGIIHVDSITKGSIVAHRVWRADVILTKGDSFVDYDDDNDEGTATNTTSVEMCAGGTKSGKGALSWQTKSRIAEGYACYRWILKGVRRSREDGEEAEPPRPVWLVSAVEGVLEEWDPQHGPLLRPRFKSKVFLCDAEVYSAEGVAELVSVGKEMSASPTTDGGDHPRPRLRVRDFHPGEQEADKLDVSAAWAFARLLDEAIRADARKETRLDVPRRVVESGTFAGDLMGYLLYRRRLSDDGNGVRKRRVHQINDLYAQVFATALSETSWLRQNVSSSSSSSSSPYSRDVEVKLEQLRWRTNFRVRKSVVAVTLIMFSFFVLTIGYLIRRRKEWLFPLAPETFENALFFLYQSTIVDQIEDRIPHPERLNIEELHGLVSGFGHRYMFGRYEDGDGHHEGFGVDCVEALQGGGSEVGEGEVGVYRDENDEGGSVEISVDAGDVADEEREGNG